METIVFSGINLVEGGPLSVYYDCLEAVKRLEMHKKYRIIAFVHSRKLFQEYVDFIEIIELPKAKTGYGHRIYYEYMYFWDYSQKNEIDIWISLHDITPRVKAKKIYTYCHNPSPFMKKDISKIKYGWKYIAFSYFYKYLYRINIKKAKAIIVQQDWIREAFLKMYPIENVIVAKPDTKIEFKEYANVEKLEKKIFMYAAFPRYFKNFEVICEACKLLQDEKKEVWLTIDGSENAYAKDIRERYEMLSDIKWLGLQPRDRIFEMYSQADCLIFPSKLETWGLPISEFKMTGKDIILVDLPYAYETLGTYDRVMFFGENDAERLAECMKMVMDGEQMYQPQVEKKVDVPCVVGWESLLNLLIL